MIPRFDHNGRLPPGVHWAEWDEIVAAFGFNRHRAGMLIGLESLLKSLVVAGCKKAYLDGSFVTNKSYPNDYDGCWEPGGVDIGKLDPVLLDFSNRRAAQKAKYLGEVFLATSDADSRGMKFIDFFQVDKDTGEQKGIIGIDLTRWVQ